ncbi:MAG TPA: hypothetical protein VFA21_06700 [Pyrinomonadaceae bacterium]|jgi:hypothetical protein|nr:hypothetical protein [Pyrinomonadaceae bacterium]
MSDAAVEEQTDTEADGDEPGLRVPFPSTSTELAPAKRSRLTTLVVAKLTLDLLFVCTLAVYSYAVAFHPFFSGSLDTADGRSVRGWVVDRARPESAVEVQLYVDGRFVADGFADQPRPDVSARGYASDERHGFVFNFDPPLVGEHVARVYAVYASRADSRRTLQQIGSAFRFNAK